MESINIGIVSDLHAEFWKPHHMIGAKVQQTIGHADLILMAGDIDNSDHSVVTAQRLFPTQPICLVAGNHEFYQQDHQMTVARLRSWAQNSNVAFLQRDSFVTRIKERAIRVLGTTLWTDFNLLGTRELSLLDAKRGLNDFRLIRRSGNILTPENTLRWHEEDKAWLLQELALPFDGITIVLTHHAPVSFAIAPRFIDDSLSPCFASRMELELAHAGVDLVVWGHTHYSIDRIIDQTRFVSNQTGYVCGIDRVETNDFGSVITV